MMDKIKHAIFLFRRSGVDRILYLCVIVLSVFGIYMIGDASIGMSVKHSSSYATINMIKQIVFLFFGYLGMFILARTFKKRWLSFETIGAAYIIVLLSMFICILWTINSAHAWIKIGPITIQPVEFMKLVIILGLSYLAGALREMFDKPRRLSRAAKILNKKRKAKFCLIIPAVLVAGAFVVCAAVQKDLGSALIILIIAYMVFLSIPGKYYNGWKKISLIALVLLLLIAPIGVKKLLPHQQQRFVVWLDPLNKEYLFKSSFQIVNGLVGYASGGLLGKGPGNSVMKYGYIPEAQNDYISAIIAEEFGLLGIMIIMFLYLVIVLRLFQYALKIEDTTSKLILIGISSYFFAHTLINLGGVSGLIPMTGVPLLLVSAGGTSTVTSLLAIGIAQSIISKYNRQQLKKRAEDVL